MIICTTFVFEFFSNSNKSDEFNVWPRCRDAGSGNDGPKSLPKPTLATSQITSKPGPRTDFHQLLRQAERNLSIPAALNNIKPIAIQWSTSVYKKIPIKIGKWPFQKCLIHNCYMIQFGGEHSRVDAFIFHVFHIEKVIMPERRDPQQKFIFFTKESKTRSFAVPRFMKSIFNVTMSHRLDSDIPVPYGAIKRKLPYDSRPRHGVNFAAKKTRFAAWVVSHCNTSSRREEYVTQMQQYVKVDIYGGCGTLKCPQRGCWEYIDKRYKFYLAFENSLCVDYVTEKVYRTLNHGKMIPIVLSAANYRTLLPEMSFIDVADFDSPRELSQYLKILDANDTLYNKYFQWRYQYKTLISPLLDYCRLCAHLHLSKSIRGVYPDIQEWFSERQCTNTSTYYGSSDDIERNLGTV